MAQPISFSRMNLAQPYISLVTSPPRENGSKVSRLQSCEFVGAPMQSKIRLSRFGLLLLPLCVALYNLNSPFFA